MAPNYLEHALAKFEKVSQTFDMILAQIFLETRLCDTDDLATRQLPVPSPKPCNVHTQTTELSRGILHGDLAQIRKDLCPIGVRTGANETMPCARPRLTCPVHASPRTHAEPCTPACPL
jgi:hypothetical protein